jgi:hypothetical protein
VDRGSGFGARARLLCGSKLQLRASPKLELQTTQKAIDSPLKGGIPVESGIPMEVVIPVESGIPMEVVIPVEGGIPAARSPA